MLMEKQRMKKSLIFMLVIGFFLLLPCHLHAQVAAELEAVLEAPSVTRIQAARFVLDSAGRDVYMENAFEYAVANGWLKNVNPNGAITMREFSFLVMQAFNMKGGMMYTFFPGPRYAYRNMLSRSFIRGAADPSMTMSGERFLQILGRVLSAEGDEQ
jgi:hypothetical protein